MLYTSGLTLITLSLIGGIISLVIQQPTAGIWSGVVCHLGFILLVIDGFIPKKGYVLHASRNHPRFSASDAVLVSVLCIFFTYGFWAFFTARNEFYAMTSHGEVLMVIAVVGWILEIAFCYWVLFDFIRSRLKRVAY